MQLTIPAAKKVEQLHHHLHREFPNAPVEAIEHEVDERLHALIAGAHFDDYVPLLVHRYVRERLRATN
jgi:hypothetical protein